MSAARVSSSVLLCVAVTFGWPRHTNDTDTPSDRSAGDAIRASVVAHGPEIDGTTDVAAGFTHHRAPRSQEPDHLGEVFAERLERGHHLQVGGALDVFAHRKTVVGERFTVEPLAIA